MNKLRHLFIVILLMIFVLPAMSQKMLLVKKDGTKYNTKFFVGDIISFKYCDGADCIKVQGKINAIDDTEGVILVGYTAEYQLKNITKIFVERKGMKVGQAVVGGAGAFYLGFTGINALLTQEQVQMSVADYVVPISLMAVAAAATPFNKRVYHLDKPHKYSLLVLDLNE